MPRRPLVLAAVLLACGPAPAPTPAATKPAPPPVATPTPPATPPPTTPPGAPVVAQPPASPPPPIAGVRDRHPIGGMPECLEMYSACSPDGKGGQTCTSAPFTLACGQTGKVPGGDTLRCVCP